MCFFWSLLEKIVFNQHRQSLNLLSAPESKNYKDFNNYYNYKITDPWNPNSNYGPGSGSLIKLRIRPNPGSGSNPVTLLKYILYIVK
jgi:hypothetical protein